MKSSHEAGLGLAEILVAIFVVAVGVITLACFYPTCGRSGPTDALSNMKQLHIATQQMAMDNAQTHEAGWPGDMGGSFSNWTHALVNGGYLSTNDLCKLLSGPGLVVKLAAAPSENSTALRVYAVKETSATNTVFLTTANFTNTPSGGLPPLANAKPYGKRGFVVFRRGGDGAVLMARQAGDTNLIGGFGPLCR